jgi:transposase
MPAKNYLKKEQKEKLQKALKEEENPEIRERILILLLLNDGKTQAEIAEFIGCSAKKVSCWCVKGDPDNLESLKDKRMEGNYKKATSEYIRILLETIDKEPAELGYEFGRWTAKRLATYLKNQTGISLSSSQVRRILERKKYVFLWAKYSLENKWDKKKRWVEFIQKGNSETFYKVMKGLYQELIREWVEAGNKAEDFAEKGAKIVIILDNASFHKKEEVIKKIESEMPNIQLEFLPEYSPDYNLIELVWHSAKEYIANRLFTSIEEVEFLLHRLLNEGELIINWNRKLKNKGNSINVV